MTVLIVPELRCNVNCGYCFAEAYKPFQSTNTEYNLEAIFAKMDELFAKRHEEFCLHGGECTLIDRQDFERILAKMFELQKRSTLQTNCYQIDDDLIRLFKKYNTSIGVSIDGDGELNSLRGFPNNPEANASFTKQVLANIERLTKEGVKAACLIILTKVNAGSVEKLERLVKFILKLREIGVNAGRINIMWTNREENKQYELTPDEATTAWLYLYNSLKQHRDLNWQPFRDFVDNLMGFSHSSCSYGKCDYYCTMTKVILADGSLGNCDRTHQEEYLYPRSEQPSYERYDILKYTDCKDCRFWNCCYGGCPAEAVNDDWRNKTRFCKATYDLYAAIENDIKTLLPNIQLITEYKDTIDYFDALKKGIHFESLEKMSWITTVNPSSWKNVKPRNFQSYQNSNAKLAGDSKC
jgi:uncharacterized protein